MTVATWPGPTSAGSRKVQWANRGGPTLVGVSVTPTGNVWARSARPAWLETVLDRLAETISLPRGWDGADARPTTENAIVAAVTVISDAMAVETVPPAVIPTSSGGLQFEWHQDGVDLEVYIEATGQISVWCQEGAREWEEDYFARARLSQELARLTAQARK